MAGVLERSLRILEVLSASSQGLALGALAERLAIPKSAAHRLLLALAEQGYVRQLRDHGDYVLTTKLVSLGLGYLRCTGITDVAQPILDRLAETSGELVRLALVDGERLVWVGRAQGAKVGLRYDPDNGAVVQLSCTATGHAWLSTMSDKKALALATKQGFGKAEDFGANAPMDADALLACLTRVRSQGYSAVCDAFSRGIAAIGYPVLKEGAVIGVLTISGPIQRLSDARMKALLPDLQDAARELAAASIASPLFQPYL